MLVPPFNSRSITSVIYIFWYIPIVAWNRIPQNLLGQKMLHFNVLQQKCSFSTRRNKTWHGLKILTFWAAPVKPGAAPIPATCVCHSLRIFKIYSGQIFGSWRRSHWAASAAAGLSLARCNPGLPSANPTVLLALQSIFCLNIWNMKCDLISLTCNRGLPTVCPH